jgi:hypothetical protein
MGGEVLPRNGRLGHGKLAGRQPQHRERGCRTKISCLYTSHGRLLPVSLFAIWSKVRSNEFSRLLARNRKRKRCLGHPADCVNPIERNTLSAQLNSAPASNNP